MKPLHTALPRLPSLFAAVVIVCGWLMLPGLTSAQTAQAASTPITSTDSSAPAASDPLAPANLFRALRTGRYVVYFRHTSTDMSQSDNGMKSVSDCANQRLLNAKGRAEARAVGRQISALKLPAGEVLASLMCRTVETAQLMIGSAEPNNELRAAGVSVELGSHPGLKPLAAPAASGSNRWLVGHGVPFRAAAHASYLAEGEAAV